MAMIKVEDSSNSQRQMKLGSLKTPDISEKEGAEAINSYSVHTVTKAVASK